MERGHDPFVLRELLCGDRLVELAQSGLHALKDVSSQFLAVAVPSNPRERRGERRVADDVPDPLREVLSFEVEVDGSDVHLLQLRGEVVEAHRDAARRVTETAIEVEALVTRHRA